jgi:hypothetical protein
LVVVNSRTDHTSGSPVFVLVVLRVLADATARPLIGGHTLIAYQTGVPQFYLAQQFLQAAALHRQVGLGWFTLFGCYERAFVQVVGDGSDPLGVEHGMTCQPMHEGGPEFLVLERLPQTCVDHGTDEIGGPVLADDLPVSAVLRGS